MIKENPRKIKRKNFEAQLIEENVIYFLYHQDAVIDVDEIKEGFRIHEELELGPDILRIIESEKYGTITKAARECVQNESKPAKAEAFVIPHLAQKILFNIYTKLRKGNHPVKGFDTFKEAKKWIDGFK
ncbi:MAG: hypothetical protein ABJG68_09770 [Crocinitomicaceae bacterium]